MIKQNPFSLYDFLGYLIPGASLFYSYLIMNEFKNNKNITLESTFNHFGELAFDKVLVFIIFSYLLGHLISYLSSITIEKMCNWKYGYPSKYLIGVGQSNYLHENGEKVGNRKKLWRQVIRIFCCPLWLWDKIFNLNRTYVKQLDSFLISALKEKVPRLFKRLKLHENFNIEKIDYHRIINHYVFEKNAGHQFKMVNYVSIYGLLRNICLVTILLFWNNLIRALISIRLKGDINWGLILSILLISIVSFILMAAFLKFYRRYTLESLMLLIADEDI